MGKEVHKRYAAAREVFKDASDATGINMARVCFGDLSHFQDDTRIIQPAIATVDLAEYAVWRETAEREADVVTGLSMGIYPAFGAAHVFNSYGETVLVVADRAKIIHEVTKGQPGKMAAIVGVTEKNLAPILRKAGAGFAVFRDRARSHFIITGDHEEVDQAKTAAKDEGARRAEDLAILGAFHSKKQEKAVEPFAEALANRQINEPQIAVLSNTAHYLTTPESVVAHSLEQLTQPADWDAVEKRLVIDGIRHVIEFGPDEKRGLTRQMAKNYGVKAINLTLPT
ncbi:hypothetical protein BVY00_01595 [bacterium G20]|nr:hypothetical protein BVY00_01595 [bacterium G20]